MKVTANETIIITNKSIETVSVVDETSSRTLMLPFTPESLRGVLKLMEMYEFDIIKADMDDKVVKFYEILDEVDVLG